MLAPDAAARDRWRRAARLLDALARDVAAGWVMLAASIRNRCGAYAYAATPDATWRDLRLAWRCLLR